MHTDTKQIEDTFSHTPLNPSGEILGEWERKPESADAVKLQLSVRMFTEEETNTDRDNQSQASELSSNLFSASSIHHKQTQILHDGLHYCQWTTLSSCNECVCVRMNMSVCLRSTETLRIVGKFPNDETCYRDVRVSSHMNTETHTGVQADRSQQPYCLPETSDVFKHIQQLSESVSVSLVSPWLTEKERKGKNTREIAHFLYLVSYSTHSIEGNAMLLLHTHTLMWCKCVCDNTTAVLEILMGKHQHIPHTIHREHTHIPTHTNWLAHTYWHISPRYTFINESHEQCHISCSYLTAKIKEKK